MTRPGGHAAGLRFWLPVIATSVAWIGIVLGLVATSPRLLAAWHGFLHAGIAARFPASALPPENPYFAGEPLSYYWFYQWVGHGLSRADSLDPLHAFQAIGLASLVLLVVTGALTGRQLYRSTAAGLIVGYLALVGMNPLGPAIAVAKYLVNAQPLIEHTALDPGGDVFVTNVQADNRLARPLLGALHVGTDWRGSQDLVWFFDVSSRGPSLALLMVLAWLLTYPTRGWWPIVALVPTGALVAAFNPLVGLPTSGALLGSAVILAILGKRSVSAPLRRIRLVAASAAFAAGAAAAFPTYAHLFAFSNPAVITFGATTVLKFAALATGFFVLLPLAVLGARRSEPGAQPALETITLTGLMLIGIVPFVDLHEGNQHNFVNAASCLLAVPAAAWVTKRAGEITAAASRRRAFLLVLTFVPMTVALLGAFAGRGGLPLVVEDGVLRRTPTGGPLDAFYQWVASSTPTDTVLVVAPEPSLKMSGNVSEIPAFTGRALFVDHVTYMTEPYPDRERRVAIARRLTTGDGLSVEDRAYLGGLDRRLMVVTFSADEPLRARLATAFGQPVFSQDNVAAYDVTGRVP